MPQSAYREYHHRVEHPASFAASVATQWEINIVSEPCGERDVPPTPKVCYSLGKIRADKVRWQLNAQKPSASDSHQRIPGKVRVNLYRVENTGQEQRRAVVLRDMGINRIHINTQPIGKA